ncbi:aminodeoxychorismate/anthranilate synthase component II [Hymenobacter sp. HMF4947]|uniref:Aminodeoxychorismate/anthranilate synthase component II n=1 Tax=Hymenobacter ginkgonis TaxID=2682976 RepID=A0A7K1TBX4_9BACT|nr:aminodeoxychorismate/anthranilate synthase component II [Hymenobacter ginkgonis]MVN75873.1 aminodeoxychorismate/anthranilate synthase component II [Hymenobacter ginkgonis]
MRLLLLDNFDSFTHTLADYLHQLGAEVLVRRNDVPLAELRALDVAGIVLSPGPGSPATAGTLLAVIAEYHQRLPMLGVCLGQQALGEFFGARLRRAARPMHGKVSEIELLGDDPWLAGLPRRQPVTRYHSLALETSSLPPTLRPLARTTDADHELMALRHATLPLFGVQFHPEALCTPHGRQWLANWLRCCNIAHPRL